MKRVLKIVSFIFTMFFTFYISFANINVGDIRAQAYDNNKNTNAINNIYNDDNTINISYLYNEALDEVVYLMNELDVDSSLEAYYVFEYILSNGYISNKTPCFTEDEKDVLDLYNEELLGLDVIYGNMNCRHITDFFTKVLVKMGYDAYVLPCYFSTDKNDISNIPNHVITIINEKNTIYIDATNKIVFDNYKGYNYLTDSNKDYYAIAMADYSSYDRNVVVSHNTNDSISHINKLVNNDINNISNKDINNEYKIAKNKIKNNKYNIDTFIIRYKKNILNNLPDKSIYITNTY